MKILTLDIETAPNVAHVWGLWQQNVGLPQLLESGYVMCFAAKWYDEDKVMWYRNNVAGNAKRLLDKADVVVHYNGTKFDIPHLQTSMVRAMLTPPSPYVQVDLCNVVKAKFNFPSNKLEYVAGELLGEHKANTGGHATWIKCMAGDRDAWAKMRHYNEQDVLLTERLYDRLKPWCKVPNVGLYDGDGTAIACPQCGSDNVIRRGLAYTQLTAYTRYSCNDCGRWSRGKHAVRRVDVR